MKEQFIGKKFSYASMGVMENAEKIISNYEAKGYALTLRQLYYQFIARNVFPKTWFNKKEKTFNTVSNYKKLGSIINDARLVGIIDWDIIEDRTRHIRGVNTWGNDWRGLLKGVMKHAFQKPKWEDTEYYVEVWVEKDALISIVEKACEGFEVPCFSCRGYVSQTEMYSAANRFKEAEGRDQTCILIHLGDHDPSGIDMTRDIQDRLDTFLARVTVERIALTKEQITRYAPPPNPAKSKDSRFKGYIKKYGKQSWELDALDPEILTALIAGMVRDYFDEDRFNEIKAEEDAIKNQVIAKLGRIKIEE